jgi:hypothetical protein
VEDDDTKAMTNQHAQKKHHVVVLACIARYTTRQSKIKKSRQKQAEPQTFSFPFPAPRGDPVDMV